MNYTVTVLASAKADLARLADFLFEREILRDGDLDYAEHAVAAIEPSLTLLTRFPFTCRKAAESSVLRELVIPSGHTGYVALFEIVASDSVVVSAIRHQREDDYL